MKNRLAIFVLLVVFMTSLIVAQPTQAASLEGKKSFSCTTVELNDGTGRTKENCRKEVVRKNKTVRKVIETLFNADGSVYSKERIKVVTKGDYVTWHSVYKTATEIAIEHWEKDDGVMVKNWTIIRER